MTTAHVSKNVLLTPDTVLGVIAGEGNLPAILARSAKDKGLKVVALALSDIAHRAVKPYADTIFECSPGQLDKAQKLLQQSNVNDVVFIGKVPAINLLFNLHKLDGAAVKIAATLPNYNYDTIQNAVGDFMEAGGFRVLKQTVLLAHLIAQPGVLTKRAPNAEEEADVMFGLQTAKELARQDTAQTVIVKNGEVLATDATQSTDDAIGRAVRKGNGNVIVCKVAKNQQDHRFDIPKVGIGTLQAMTVGGRRGGVLAIEAGQTMVVEKEAMMDYCDVHDISLVCVPEIQLSEIQ